MKVEVYFNLHKKVFSIRKPNGVVIKHDSYVAIKNPKYVVQPAGNEKVRKEKRKNVHAYVRGEMVDTIPELGMKVKAITYNPYKNKTFVLSESQKPTHESDYAVLYTMDERGKICGFFKEK